MGSDVEKRSSWKIFKAVLYALVLREFMTRLGARRMGAFWLLFEPVAHILVLLTIFTVVRERVLPGLEFPVFLVSGIIPFLLMKNVALKGMDAISANKALFSYRQIKPFDCYVSRLIVETILYSIVYIIVSFALYFWGRYDVGINQPVPWFFSLLLGLLFSFSLGILFSILVYLVPEVKTFIKLAFMPLYLLSGVIFPVWAMPRSWLPWVLWNPYLHIIEDMRSSVFVNYPYTPGVSFAYPALLTVTLLFLSLALYWIFRARLVSL